MVCRASGCQRWLFTVRLVGLPCFTSLTGRKFYNMFQCGMASTCTSLHDDLTVWDIQFTHRWLICNESLTTLSLLSLLPCFCLVLCKNIWSGKSLPLVGDCVYHDQWPQKGKEMYCYYLYSAGLAKSLCKHFLYWLTDWLTAPYTFLQLIHVVLLEMFSPNKIFSGWHDTIYCVFFARCRR